jgi:hypothetical protein
VLVEEPIEEFVGIVNAELLVLDLVVMVAAVDIGKSCVGFVNLIEAALGVNSVVGVLFGMRFSSKLLIGSLDVLLGGFLIETKEVVEILPTICVSSSCRLGRATGVGSGGIDGYTGFGG